MMLGQIGGFKIQKQEKIHRILTSQQFWWYLGKVPTLDLATLDT